MGTKRKKREWSIGSKSRLRAEDEVGKATYGSQVVAKFLDSRYVSVSRTAQDFEPAFSLRFCLFRVFSHALHYYQTHILEHAKPRKVRLEEIRRGFLQVRHLFSFIKYSWSMNSLNSLQSGFRFSYDGQHAYTRMIYGVEVRALFLFGVSVNLTALTGKANLKASLAALLNSREFSSSDDATLSQLLSIADVQTFPRAPDATQSLPESYCELPTILRATQPFADSGPEKILPVIPLQPVEGVSGTIRWESTLETHGISHRDYNGRGLPLLPLIKDKLFAAEEEGKGSEDGEKKMEKLTEKEARECMRWIKVRSAEITRCSASSWDGDWRRWWLRRGLGQRMGEVWEWHDHRAESNYNVLEQLVLCKTTCECDTVKECDGRCALVHAMHIANEAVSFLRSVLAKTWAYESALVLNKNEELKGRIRAGFFCIAALPECTKLGMNKRVVHDAVGRVLKGIQQGEIVEEATVFKLMQIVMADYTGEAFDRMTTVNTGEIVLRVTGRVLNKWPRAAKVKEFLRNVKALTELYK